MKTKLSTLIKSLVICTIAVVSLFCIYYYFRYTGRVYQKSLSETWKVYHLDPVTNGMSNDPVFDLSVNKEEDIVLLSYQSKSYEVSFTTANPKECTSDDKAIRVFFGANFDCVVIEERPVNDSSSSTVEDIDIYLGLKDNIPFFINNEKNRFELIEKVSLGLLPFEN